MPGLLRVIKYIWQAEPPFADEKNTWKKLKITYLVIYTNLEIVSQTKYMIKDLNIFVMTDNI